MELYTPAQLRQLLSNARRSQQGDEGFDPAPVVKWFTPFGDATWLITELDPANQMLAFGLADLGLGFPELGYVSIAEITGYKGPLGLGVERDLGFEAAYPISTYAAMARHNRRIVA